MDDTKPLESVISVIAAENCVDEKIVRDLINDPGCFIVKRETFWMHRDNQRNSPSRMIDGWMANAIKQYDYCGRDLGLGENTELGVSSAISIDDIIGKHINNSFVLSADIKLYFDSITYGMVGRHLPPSLSSAIRVIYFINNDTGLKRGLKASASIAEIVGRHILDNNIKGMIYHKWGKGVVEYSRYCDDMILSSQNKTILREAEQELASMLIKIGFILNPNKTKLKPLSSSTILGRRIHNKSIIISKRRRNRARLRYYNALKTYEQCDRSDEDDILRSLAAVESALGTANYINQYHNVDEGILGQLKNACGDLSNLLQEKTEDSPFI